MSVDKLQDMIRKLKNPTVIDFTVMPDQVHHTYYRRRKIFVMHIRSL